MFARVINIILVFVINNNYTALSCHRSTAVNQGMPMDEEFTNIHDLTFVVILFNLLSIKFKNMHLKQTLDEFEESQSK